MNKLVLALIILSALALMLPAPAPAATDVQVEQGLGFLDVATPTISVGPTAAVIIGTLPAKTLNAYVTAFGGDVLIGNNSDLASGTVWTAAAKIASGTTVKIDGINTDKPKIYFLSNSTATCTIVIGAWGY